MILSSGSLFNPNPASLVQIPVQFWCSIHGPGSIPPSGFTGLNINIYHNFFLKKFENNFTSERRHPGTGSGYQLRAVHACFWDRGIWSLSQRSPASIVSHPQLQTNFYTYFEKIKYIFFFKQKYYIQIGGHQRSRKDRRWVFPFWQNLICSLQWGIAKTATSVILLLII